MAMPKSRWVYSAERVGEHVWVEVSLEPWNGGAQAHLDRTWCGLSQLTRQELRRVCANLSIPSTREDSVNDLLDRIMFEFGVGSPPPTVTEPEPTVEPTVEPEPTFAEPTAPSTTVQGAHKDFAAVLRRVVAGLTLWLHGEAGTGKTTLAIQIAKAMGLPFRGVSVTAQMTAAQFFGYTNAMGDVVRTDFREVWEHGGVFLIDEASSAMANLAAGINMALANGVCAFPDGMIDRHPDCHIMAAANDVGMGPTPKYPKGLKQDASFRDRFVFHELTLDMDVVKSGVTSRCDAATAEAWLKVWNQARANVKSYGLDLVITPRSAFDGATLLSIGDGVQSAARDAILKGAPDAVAEKVLEGTGVKV